MVSILQSLKEVETTPQGKAKSEDKTPEASAGSLPAPEPNQALELTGKTLARFARSSPRAFGFAQKKKTKNLVQPQPLLWKADGNATVL